MECITHPNAPATDRCFHCGQYFCPDCLVEVNGAKYCANCKATAVQTPPTTAIPPVPLPMGQQMPYQQSPMGTQPCKEAGEALTFAIVGLFCFGIILEPLAIAKALKAKKMIEMNPSLEGAGKAQAALIIACIGLGLWVLGIIVRIAGALATTS
ncbi:MAG: hypothetical protein ACYDBB_19045 [Armatimonadota bacterium]